MELQFQMQQKEVFSATKQTINKERNRRAKSKSKFVGVRQRSSGKWVAEIKNTTQNIRMWLGTFDTSEAAARAYDEAACLLRGPNARTNFVNPVPSNSALSLKIRNLLNQKKGLMQTTTSSHSSKTSGLKQGVHMLGDHGYKPDLSSCNGGIEMGSCYFDQKSAFATEFESFDGLALSQEEGLEVPKGVGLVSERSSESEIQNFERMKVERQISASLYAINGVNEYWENVHDSSDVFWDLPMLCQMFFPS